LSWSFPAGLAPTVVSVADDGVLPLSVLVPASVSGAGCLLTTAAELILSSMYAILHARGYVSTLGSWEWEWYIHMPVHVLRIGLLCHGKM
jgi:hypothetical protein